MGERTGNEIQTLNGRGSQELICGTGGKSFGGLRETSCDHLLRSEQVGKLFLVQ